MRIHVCGIHGYMTEHGTSLFILLLQYSNVKSIFEYPSVGIQQRRFGIENDLSGTADVSPNKVYGR